MRSISSHNPKGHYCSSHCSFSFELMPGKKRARHPKCFVCDRSNNPDKPHHPNLQLIETLTNLPMDLCKIIAEFTHMEKDDWNNLWTCIYCSKTKYGRSHYNDCCPKSRFVKMNHFFSQQLQKRRRIQLRQLALNDPVSIMFL